MPQTRSPFRLLKTDRRGSTAIEFAIVGNAFVVLMIAIMELSWQFTTGAMLDMGALRASRFGATGQETRPGAPSEITCRSAYIPWMLSNSTNGFLKQSDLTVTATAWSGVSGVSGTGAASPGTGGQIVRYDVAYPQPFITFAWLNLFGGPAVVTHRASVVIKNEPFENATC